MRTRIIALAITTLVGGLAAEAREFQKQPADSEPRLSARIPPADRKRYLAVRDPHDWRNPYLMASATGFELKSASSPKSRAISLKDLRRELASLPISDWPYGRVVVLQSPSILPSDQAWVAAMMLNLDGAREILKALGADEWGWPA